MNKFVFVILFSALAASCATAPDKMPTTYVSPLKYQQYDCDQLAIEMGYIEERTTKLYTSLDKKAKNDSAQMGLGLILFWPSLFFLEGGDGPEAAEYSQLKGEYEAIRQVTVQKKCLFEMKSPEDIIKEQESLTKDKSK